MKRKIISHGPSSLTITLPSHWVKKNFLKKGDEIDVFEKNNQLIIKNNNLKKIKKNYEISLEGLGKRTREEILLILHLKGYDEIKIKCNENKLSKEIYSFLTKNHLGFEIIKQNNEYLIIKNISNPDQNQLEDLLKRIFRIVIEYSAKITELLDEKEITEIIFLHEISINRIANYCRRLIMNNSEKSLELEILRCLELVTNNLTKIKNVFYKEDFDEKEKKNVFSFLEEFTDILMQIYNLKESFNLKKYDELKKRLEKINLRLNKNAFKKSFELLIHIDEGLNFLLKGILSIQI